MTFIVSWDFLLLKFINNLRCLFKNKLLYFEKKIKNLNF